MNPRDRGFGVGGLEDFVVEKSTGSVCAAVSLVFRAFFAGCEEDEPCAPLLSDAGVSAALRFLLGALPLVAPST